MRGAPAQVGRLAPDEAGGMPAASPAHASSGSGVSALDLIRVARVPSASPLDPVTQVRPDARLPGSGSGLDGALGEPSTDPTCCVF